MLSRRTFTLIAASTPAFALAGWGAHADAQGTGADLNVSPRRLVIPETGRTESVLVFNRGTGPATYNIECIDRIMTLDGGVRALTDPANPPDAAAAGARLKSAKEFVVFTPRRVTLQPGESQTIRIRISRPDNLAAGEYRTHLTVTAVPPQSFGLTADQAASAGSSDSLSVQLIPLFSISIPIIVRQGAPDARAELRDFKLVSMEDGKRALSFNLVRTGPSSLFGDLDIKGGPRGTTALGALHGVAVYPEIDRRQVSVVLNAPVAASEDLLITFTDQEGKPGTVLARQTFKA